jgi:long-chain acyl-CoA synthetase
MGVFSKNREEWTMTDLACLRSSVTIIPFFDSLGMASLEYILNQTELTTMAVEGKNVQHLIDLKKNKCKHLINLLSFDLVTDD